MRGSIPGEDVAVPNMGDVVEGHAEPHTVNYLYGT